MKELDLDGLGYASKWGLTDFYEGRDVVLREAIDSGEDFDTGWFGCKKEIRYARIVREEGELAVYVSAYMDDLWDSEDLIYDALWTACNSEKELSGETIDNIRDWAIDDGIDDVTELSMVLSEGASFEDVVAAVDKLEGEAEENNTDMFDRLCEIVKNFVSEEKE